VKKVEILAMALLIAVFGERLTEYFVVPLFTKAGWDKAYLLYVGALPGFILSVAARIDLFAMLGVALPYYLGVIATGLAVGGGANLIHDIFDQNIEYLTADIIESE